MLAFEVGYFVLKLFNHVFQFRFLYFFQLSDYALKLLENEAVLKLVSIVLEVLQQLPYAFFCVLDES